MSAAWPPGWRVRRHEVLLSTQDEAIAAAKRDEAGSLAVLAARQTAGRGRGGRSWIGGAGNLFVSLLLRPAAAPVGACWAELAGVALFDAVAGTGASGLTLKHPNDLLLHGVKLGGLLVDTALAADGALDWVVIGAGVNISEAPIVPGRRAASLGVAMAPEGLAAQFACEIQRGLDAGWARIHAVWTERTGVVAA